MDAAVHEHTHLANVERLLTPREVADLLAIPEETLCAWRARRQQLPYVKVGHLVRYRRDDLALYLAERVRPSQPEEAAA